jgi:long-chain fatty acid transport protein
MNKSLQASLAVILSLGMGTQAFAVGSSFISNEVPSARAAGQGYVGIAGQIEDPTAVYENPAAITSLPGTQATLGGTWENIHGGYQNNSGSETKERVVDVAVPNFSATQNFLDGKLAAGLSVQSPFGLETHWEGDSPLRYVATDSRVGMVDITPAVAYKIIPMLSVGAGVDYDNLFNAQLDKHVNNDMVNLALFQQLGLGSPTSGSPDAVASLRGSGADWGYHAGLVFQPAEQHAIGLTYHSKVNIRVNGNETITGITGPVAQGIFGGSNFTTSAYTDVVLPSSVELGYAFKPNKQWLMEADAAWYHWSEARDLDVRFPAATALQQGLMAQLGSTIPLNLRDAWSMTSGVNYKANDRWQFRGGFWYEPSIVPEAYFSPAFMDQTRYGLSSGVGYAFTENFSLDLAYNAVFTHTRIIQNNVGTNSSLIPAGGVPLLGIPSPDISGTYSDFANLVALNFTYRFGAVK